MWLFNSNASINNFEKVSGSVFIPNNWKKSNSFYIHNKADCSKIFERIIFNPIFNFFWRKKSVCPNKSSFRSLDLCENQWLSLVHDIYDNFDQNPIFFFCLGFLLYTQTIHRTTGEGRGHFYSSITFTRSWTFIHVFANLLLKWLLRIFNCSACNYQVVTRWDLTMGNRYLIWMLDR